MNPLPLHLSLFRNDNDRCAEQHTDMTLRDGLWEEFVEEVDSPRAPRTIVVFGPLVRHSRYSGGVVLMNEGHGATWSLGLRKIAWPMRRTNGGRWLLIASLERSPVLHRTE